MCTKNRETKTIKMASAALLERLLLQPYTTVMIKAHPIYADCRNADRMQKKQKTH